MLRSPFLPIALYINLCNNPFDITVGGTMGQDRIVTRNDLDGLICAALLIKLELANSIEFAHPRDIESGNFKVNKSDILVSLPYIEGVQFVFDHIDSPLAQSHTNYITTANAQSTSRVIFDYLGGKAKFPNLQEDILIATEKSILANYTIDEILHPTDWNLLGFIMDHRTGLERFKDFKNTTDNLIRKLAISILSLNIKEILQSPDLKERADLYFEQEKMFDEQIKRCSFVHEKLLVVDVQDENTVYAGNRFRMYALYPDTNISMQISRRTDAKTVGISVGKSIFDRSSKVNIGSVMREFGGGGHANAGSCQIAIEKADLVKHQLIDQLNLS